MEFGKAFQPNQQKPPKSYTNISDFLPQFLHLVSARHNFQASQQQREMRLHFLQHVFRMEEQASQLKVLRKAKIAYI